MPMPRYTAQSARVAAVATFAVIGMASRGAKSSSDSVANAHPRRIVVESDAPAAAQVRAGDTIAITPSVRNTGRAPVVVIHGARLFVFEATLTKPQRKPGTGPQLNAPPGNTWGLLSSEHWEYPNPYTPEPMWAREVTIKPGERYPPAALHKIPFDSVGTYRVKICAFLRFHNERSDEKICASQISVITVSAREP